MYVQLAYLTEPFFLLTDFYFITSITTFVFAIMAHSYERLGSFCHLIKLSPISSISICVGICIMNIYQTSV